MTGDYTSIEAQEHRDRRRRRILENAEKRMSAILSGPDGTETRAAPSFDGLTEPVQEVDEKYFFNY